MRLKNLRLLQRFFPLLLLSVAMMFASHHNLLPQARTAASAVALPFQYLMHMPGGIAAWVRAHYPDDSLYQKYDDLLIKQLQLEARLQRYESLRAENERLNELLRAPRRRIDHAQSAAIIEIGLEPFTQRNAINRGSESGIYMGQPVINAAGVLGQVSDVGVRHSVVTLITHPKHSIPVQIRRNGLRTIVQGAVQHLLVPFLPGLADIREGDVLVTSGVGGRFPSGYKVARVREVINDINSPFLTVYADPYADIRSGGKVLLLHKPSAPDAK